MRLRDIDAEAAGLTRDEIVQAVRDAARRKRQGAKLGRVLTMAEMAQALGWRTERVRRHMVRVGVAYQRGSRWYVTASELRRADPRFWLELELEAAGR